jgi:hypothetical protein
LSTTTWNVILGGIIAIVASLTSQAVLLYVQGRREERTYKRRLRGERQTRLLTEFATLASVALDFFRLARLEYRLLEQHQAKVSPWRIVRRFRHPISVGQALMWKQDLESLTVPIQDRLWDLKRSISSVRLDSDLSKLHFWDELVKALDELNEKFLQTVPKNRRDLALVPEMKNKLEHISALYDKLFESMRRELADLEG